MNELTIVKHNGGSYVDSRDVAALIGKQHKHLLRDIRGYRETMRKSFRPTFGLNDFFVESSYTDPVGRDLPCYLLSKMGCEMVALKLTGEKGVLFTAAYVAKFNAMEAAERAREIEKRNAPRLSEFNSAVRNVLSGMNYAGAAPVKVMDFLRGVYNPLGIAVATAGVDFEFRSATDIARRYGVYSETGRPHGHAVAVIIDKLDFPIGEHVAIVPYGLVGVGTLYDVTVAIAVAQWLIDNHCPSEVPHNGFSYHICYRCETDNDPREAADCDDEDGEYDDDGDEYEIDPDDLDGDDDDVTYPRSRYFR